MPLISKLKDGDPMPFGKYKGRRLIDVPAVYLLWLYENGLDHEALKNYIIDNLSVLRREAGPVKIK